MVPSKCPTRVLVWDVYSLTIMDEEEGIAEVVHCGRFEDFSDAKKAEKKALKKKDTKVRCNQSYKHEKPIVKDSQLVRVKK